MNYVDFISSKARPTVYQGVDPQDLNDCLFDFQEWIVKRALKAGRFAVFADCGLGKTIIQLSWAEQVVKITGMPVLILAPLAVSEQTILQGRQFGIDVFDWTEAPDEPSIMIANYEQLDNIDTSLFSGIVLDESSILKNFEGKTKARIISSFSSTQYKLACTATPSPNDDMEICNHAEFLGYGSRLEILSMYFTHDGGQTSKWRLKGHAIDRFWQFVSTWSVMVSNPSDIGFDGSKYILPEINYISIDIPTPIKSNRLFNDINVSATGHNAELRNTLELRLDKVVDIANNTPGQIIIWIKQDVEAKYLRERIPDAIEVKGGDKPGIKKQRLIGFGKNEFRIMITKAKIAQFGLNYQNCATQIEASLDFSFEALYQKTRRSYRFGQKENVTIYIIKPDTMGNVIASIKRKEEQFKNIKNKLSKWTSNLSIATA
jgi:hypothetical protein